VVVKTPDTRTSIYIYAGLSVMGAKRPPLRDSADSVRVMRPCGEPGEHVSDVHGVLV